MCHTLDQPLKNGVPLTSRIRNDAAPVEIDDSNARFWDTRSEATPHDLCKAWELCGSRCKEVNKSPFVDRNQARFVIGPRCRVCSLERSKKGVQNGFIRVVAFVLATILVTEKPTAT
jgi:hypothetical protein